MLTELKASTDIDEKILESRYKYGMVLIGIAFLKDYDSVKNDVDHADDEEMNVYEKIKFASRVISPILLPMISGLGDIDDSPIISNG